MRIAVIGGTGTRNFLDAERRAKVGHHVLLSIVGVDRIEGNAHFAGKRRQEELLSASPIPVTIQRATQFHEFAGTVVAWTRLGDVATVPPLLMQPVAASDVGEVLAEIAAGQPQGRAPDLAGPEPQDLVDMGPTNAGRSRRVDPADPQLAQRHFWDRCRRRSAPARSRGPARPNDVRRVARSAECGQAHVRSTIEPGGST